jgi:hypothetical protein
MRLKQEDDVHASALTDLETRISQRMQEFKQRDQAITTRLLNLVQERTLSLQN